MSGRLIRYPSGWTLAVLDDHDAAEAAVGALAAHFINRFGAWATEEISPWRGTMPDLPQHMQR